MTDKLLDLTKTVVAAYVSNNSVATSGLPSLIADVASALTNLATTAAVAPEKPVPAVNPKRSVNPDFIVCLEDGKKFRSLKRHLMVRFGMTPHQYREKWGLPFDYPMVAPNYAEARSAVAKRIGFGRRAEAAPARVTTTPSGRQAKGAPTETPSRVKSAGKQKATSGKASKFRQKASSPSIR
jgi:predicted transcriptional regulator